MYRVFFGRSGEDDETPCGWKKNLLLPLLRLFVRNTRSMGCNCMYFCLSYSCVVSIYNALPLFISIFHFSRGNVSSIFVVHLIIHFLHRKKMEKSHVILQKYMFSDVSLNICLLNYKKSLKIDRKIWMMNNEDKQSKWQKIILYNKYCWWESKWEWRGRYIDI